MVRNTVAPGRSTVCAGGFCERTVFGGRVVVVTAPVVDVAPPLVVVVVVVGTPTEEQAHASPTARRA
jgi:hypothetical protein